MEKDQVKSHWQELAATYGSEVSATTKTATAKQIELGVLKKVLEQVNPKEDSQVRILEAGCGNGVNIFELADLYRNWSFYGFDFASEMINAAEMRKSQAASKPFNVRFEIADLLEPDIFQISFDIVYTVRALINLTSSQDQLDAIQRLAEILKPGGYLVFLENFESAHESQNRMRQILGLEPRKQAEYNIFMNEASVISKLKNLGLEDIRVLNYTGLHDMLLYVLLPQLNEGKIDYSDPLVHLSAKLTSSLELDQMNNLGSFGQNRLVLARKP